MSSVSGPRRRVLESSPFAPPAERPEVPTFEVGDQVTHDRHGMGRVVVVGYPDVVRVDFGTSGIRQMAASDQALKPL
jgi:hypothetical protein